MSFSTVLHLSETPILIRSYFVAVPANTRTIRSCGWDESNYKGKCYQRGGFGGRQEVCSCTSDFCNGATNYTILNTLFYFCFLHIILMIIAF